MHRNSDLFECLTAINLLHAFHHLNSRFDTLLFKHFYGYNLDFRSISKQKFDLFIQENLPLFINQIKSLYLSNNDETPEQIQMFFTHDLSLPHFVYLQSLSISYLYSEPTMLKIIGELYHLPHLVGSTNLNEIACLSRHIPHLQYLRLLFNDNSTKVELSDIMSSMISLNITVRDSLFTLTNILKNMPNLYRLKIETQSTNLDGYEWEYIISYHLYALIVKNWFSINEILRKNASHSIRRLDFQSDISSNDRTWLIANNVLI
jgi:hypothetical protein